MRLAFCYLQHHPRRGPATEALALLAVICMLRAVWSAHNDALLVSILPVRLFTCAAQHQFISDNVRSEWRFHDVTSLTILHL